MLISSTVRWAFSASWQIRRRWSTRTALAYRAANPHIFGSRRRPWTSSPQCWIPRFDPFLYICAGTRAGRLPPRATPPETRLRSWRLWRLACCVSRRGGALCKSLFEGSPRGLGAAVAPHLKPGALCLGLVFEISLIAAGQSWNSSFRRIYVAQP